ncbi:MAG: helix-turn-helix domain-containing protein [Bacteroidota bacterium]
MEKLTFEELPGAVSEIREQLGRIEMALTLLCEHREPENTLLTLAEAAEFLKLAESTIYTKVCRMEIPVIKKSKRLYFEKGELLNWLMEGKRTTQSESSNVAEDFLKNRSPRKAARVRLKR